MIYYNVIHSKIRFDYLNPRPEDILIEDIAHALSQICRFTGHTSLFFSVAQHSIFVSKLVSPEFALAGLLHDAQEAYVNDLSSPLKTIIDGNYNMIHDLIQRTILTKFGLSPIIPDNVKLVDEIVTINELWCLIDSNYKSEEMIYAPKLIYEITCWSPIKAKAKFLKRFEELYIPSSEKI